MSKIPRAEWGVISMRHARGETIAKIAQDYGCTAPAIHYILKRQKHHADPVPAAAEAERRRAPQPAPPPVNGNRAGADEPVGERSFPGPAAARRVPALVAGLDARLHNEAEAVIAEFRDSFDAALAAGSPPARARLRRAAAELMRIGARTTIVLDRLGARETAARHGRDASRAPVR